MPSIGAPWVAAVSATAAPTGWRDWAATLLVASLFALLILEPVLARPGWPYNHESLSFITRMSGIAGQWQLGHLLPVWSTAEQWGYGSPAPALYHKAFAYLSATVLLATGSPKASLCAALLTFMVAGFCGAAMAVRLALGRADHLAEWTAGALVISCNYATTDWFIRGAFAEFAGMAVVTWVFAWCAALLVTGRWPLWIGPIMALLVVSHVTIALFSLLPLSLAVLFASAAWGAGAARWIKPAVVSIVLFAVLCAPFMLPIALMSNWARIDALQQPGYELRSSHVPIDRLLWDTAWHWGERWTGYTIQLDLVLVAALLTAALASQGRPAGRVTPFLFAVLIVMVLLQTSLAIPLYEAVPGGVFIQFSWRLLTFISVSLAISGGLLTARVAAWRPGLGVAVAAGLLASTVPNQPWWSGIHYGWYNAAQLEAAVRGNLAAAGEYLPRTTAMTAPATDGNVPVPAFHDPDTCTVLPDSDDGVERREAAFHIACRTAAEVALPLFEAPGMAARAVHAGAAAEISIRRTCDDPRARVALGAGESLVTIEFPAWTSLIRARASDTGFWYARDCRPPEH